MQIIVFPRNRKKPLHLALGWGSSIAALVMAVVLVGYLADLRGAYLHKQAMEGQVQALEDVKGETATALDVMAGRVSLLQSHVVRLDALGARLADMAQLDDFDFGLDSPPGLGGPHGLVDGESQGLSSYDFLTSLNRLEFVLQDRQDKLSAMEVMLMGRSLQSQSQPLGKPVKGGWLSSSFGYRTDPISGKRVFHPGIDVAGRSGMPVTSIASGIVTWSGAYQGYGNLVEISHGNGYMTRYAHNKENLVNVGEKVEKGQVIAVMGSTGRSTGAHVHFEVVKNGSNVNPYNYISAR